MFCRVGIRELLIYFIHTNIEEDDAKRNRSDTKGILPWQCNKKKEWDKTNKYLF